MATLAHVRGWPLRLVRFVARQEARALGAALLVVAAVWGFVELADEVIEGETQSFDTRVLQMLRSDGASTQPIGPPWLASAAVDITALGSLGVLSLAIAATLGYLLMRRKYHAMWLVLIATVGGEILSSVLKWSFARPRPDRQLHLVEVATASFPSGHAMLAAVVYLTLGALLARLEKRRRMKVYIIGVAMLLTGLIGLSRVYLGVHYPTDVLAGWCAGLTWALICWLLARWLQQRGQIESPSAESPPAGA